ncbi:DUF4065 domain-containing protein [Siccirubricoccus sp. KC 17139]|uniref:DUF4065 domain-containing protein n=1 Tax=Siccirubricoccus soli TaxID=2899147 RepID=A0ABT1CZR3_9PROT|nr:DUF4065 domain-containing protein [Siccirubricoccus soli]MCP2681294.1 DUF4065 domain-containing protein [Siccirubricoccus soli]
MTYDARAVANALLDLAGERGIPLTHMAVHKIIYYAHGWYSARHGKPLVRQEFEAWKDGPVLRLVWESLREAGSKPVTERATRFDPVRQVREVVKPNLDANDHRFLGDILSAYGHIHAFELSEMTHAPGGPWDAVWNAPNRKVTLGMRIPHDAIRKHFQKVAASHQKA